MRWEVIGSCWCLISEIPRLLRVGRDRAVRPAAMAAGRAGSCRDTATATAAPPLPPLSRARRVSAADHVARRGKSPAVPGRERRSEPAAPVSAGPARGCLSSVTAGPARGSLPSVIADPLRGLALFPSVTADPLGAPASLCGYRPRALPRPQGVRTRLEGSRFPPCSGAAPGPLSPCPRRGGGVRAAAAVPGCVPRSGGQGRTRCPKHARLGRGLSSPLEGPSGV